MNNKFTGTKLAHYSWLRNLTTKFTDPKLAHYSWLTNLTAKFTDPKLVHYNWLRNLTVKFTDPKLAHYSLGINYISIEERWTALTHYSWLRNLTAKCLVKVFCVFNSTWYKANQPNYLILSLPKTDSTKRRRLSIPELSDKTQIKALDEYILNKRHSESSVE